MKFIIELSESEAKAGIETGALLALIEQLGADETPKKKKAKKAPVEEPKELPHDIPGAPTNQTFIPAAHAQIVPAAPVVPTAPVQYTAQQLAVAAMQLKDQGRLPELQGQLAQFGVSAITQLKPEQISQFAAVLQGMGVKL